ncbi:hypothetical protein ACFSTD_03305 [Novosphingobium colocasiae]
MAELAPWIARLYVTKVSVPADYVLSCGLFNDWACLRVQLAGEWTAQTADGLRAHDRAALLFGPQSRIMPVTVKGSFISVGASYRPGALQAMNGIKVGGTISTGWKMSAPSPARAMPCSTALIHRTAPKTGCVFWKVVC